MITVRASSKPRMCDQPYHGERADAGFLPLPRTSRRANVGFIEMFWKFVMLAQLRIACLALTAAAFGLAAAPAAASHWNTPLLVTGAAAQDPSESGTDGWREDEPDAGRQGEDPSQGGAGREAFRLSDPGSG